MHVRGGMGGGGGGEGVSILSRRGGGGGGGGGMFTIIVIHRGVRLNNGIAQYYWSVHVFPVLTAYAGYPLQGFQS